MSNVLRETNGPISYFNKGKKMKTLLQQSRPLAAAALIAGCAAMTQQAGATVIATEYFNGYGASEIKSDGTNLSSGTGWDTAWTNADEKYVPGTSISYAAAGYDNSGNLSGAGDGAMVYAGNLPNPSVSIVTRNFTTTSDTVWYSALISIDEAWDRALLWIASPDDASWGNDFVGVLDGNIHMRYNNNNVTSAGASTAGTHLLLAKAELNVSGANDRLSFWFNPDLSSGEGGLGAATYTDDSADTFGTALGRVGVMLIDRDQDGSGGFVSDPNEEIVGGELIDAIRVGTTFADVTTVPEPSSLALLGLGGLLIARRRRG